MDPAFNKIEQCKIFNLAKIENRKGNLTPVYNSVDIPFGIKRVYYLYDVPGGETRGGHAHRELQQFIVSVSGSFDVRLDDGREQKIVTLNRSYYGLYVPTMIWRELVNFSTGAICLVLASLPYLEAEYIRDYNSFRAIKQDILTPENDLATDPIS